MCCFTTLQTYSVFQKRLYVLTYDLNVYVQMDTVKYADDLVLLAKE
jgi:hypothetical protein